MWKKDDTPGGTPDPEGAKSEKRERPRSGTGGTQKATIGRSIRIQGEVSGDEDLLIEGRVEGSVNLGQHTVTIGAGGEVEADIIGRVVTVEGTVQGDLRAEEQVILLSSAQVEGDITAPRVVLEDGARFLGGVDMGEPDARSSSTPASRKRPGATTDAPGRSPGQASSATAPKEKSAGDRPKDQAAAGATD